MHCNAPVTTHLKMTSRLVRTPSDLWAFKEDHKVRSILLIIHEILKKRIHTQGTRFVQETFR